MRKEEKEAEKEKARREKRKESAARVCVWLWGLEKSLAGLPAFPQTWPFPFTPLCFPLSRARWVKIEKSR